ncbi:MAG: GGDEF domain-containing protein [Treponema sp.]|nr:GGDEF domain-containing protein [Candidatus Treponema equifaecale]
MNDKTSPTAKAFLNPNHTEKMYFDSILSTSILSFEINVSKDLIETDISYQDENGEIFHPLQQVGLTAPCSLTEFFQKWKLSMIPEAHRSEYPIFDDPCSILHDYYEKGLHEVFFEFWSKHARLDKAYIAQRFILLKKDDGELWAYTILNNISSIRIQKKAEEKKILEKYAYVDPVTGGDNYIKFKEMVIANNLPGYIVSVDVRDFKIINSSHGVSKADEFLKYLWTCIATTISAGDYAGHINADHFVIYVSTENQDEVAGITKSISLAMSLISIDLELPPMELYFGIAHWSPERKIELSYSEAVAAKHKAKEDKNVNYAFFSKNDTDKIIEEKKLESEFDTALEKKEFKIWFQPKFSPSSRNVVGAEALIRWQKADGTLIPPGKFIPLFERDGKIRALDEYVFKNVCLQQKKWQDAGKKIVPVSINLSRASLYYKNIVGKYRWIVEEIGIDTDYIPIEITESAAVTNNDIQAIADSFYNAGFHLHLDDFGSGYSSLASLNTLHFDTLKIDKSLVDYIGNYSGDRLLEHTISLARELGMHVTAEGVEKENQNNYLRHIGCNSIQGYYFSKPVPLEEFEKMLDLGPETTSLSESDLVEQRVDKIRQSFLRISKYDFIVDLENNEAKEAIGSCDWQNETNFWNLKYDDCIAKIANDLILPEYKQDYLNTMSRKNLLQNWDGKEQTKILYYKRWLNGKITDIKLTAHLFRVKESPKPWLYVSVTDLE